MASAASFPFKTKKDYLKYLLQTSRRSSDKIGGKSGHNPIKSLSLEQNGHRRASDSEVVQRPKLSVGTSGALQRPMKYIHPSSFVDLAIDDGDDELSLPGVPKKVTFMPTEENKLQQRDGANNGKRVQCSLPCGLITAGELFDSPRREKVKVKQEDTTDEGGWYKPDPVLVPQKQVVVSNSSPNDSSYQQMHPLGIHQAVTGIAKHNGTVLVGQGMTSKLGHIQEQRAVREEEMFQAMNMNFRLNLLDLLEHRKCELPIEFSNE